MKIRRVRDSDIDKIYLIRNDPYVRRDMFNTSVISRRVNYEFWKSPFRNGWVIINANKVCGVIRFEDRQVDVFVSSFNRRKGLAYNALKKFNLNGLTAEIKPGNQASMGLFEKLGFKLKKLVYEKEDI